LLALFVIPRWTSSGCERTTISRAGWNLSACLVEGFTGSLRNRDRGRCVQPPIRINCQKRTTMSSSSIRKHAGNGAASDQPTVPEPSFSERARTLGYFGRIREPVDAFAQAAGVPLWISDAIRVGRTRASHLPHQHDGYAYSKLASGFARQPACEAA
jgi:hypothetical protein